jgi:hypothetical protein
VLQQELAAISAKVEPLNEAQKELRSEEERAKLESEGEHKLMLCLTLKVLQVEHDVVAFGDLSGSGLA